MEGLSNIHSISIYGRDIEHPVVTCYFIYKGLRAINRLRKNIGMDPKSIYESYMTSILSGNVNLFRSNHPFAGIQYTSSKN